MQLSSPTATSPPVSSSFDLKLARFSSSPSYSTSPPDSMAFSGRQRRLTRTGTTEIAKQLKPFATADIKICMLTIIFQMMLILVLLENVAQTGVDILKNQGYQVSDWYLSKVNEQIEFHKTSLSEEQLIEKIRDVQAIGIRSKTKLTENVLKHAQNLVCIGCFCIGTNQVDLEYAAKRGIAVFNSPFSNSRSVAELVISEIIALSRQYVERTHEMRNGMWNKVSSKCWEIRGKTLGIFFLSEILTNSKGIVGYGHIGSQLSVLAESMGMQVVYYDVFPIMVPQCTFHC
jgi:D-3-phosphoglycerate dehydrogenase / 2-oxoglutarate reductase